MIGDVEKRLESRMLGNSHVRFGVGVMVKLRGLHHHEVSVWGLNEALRAAYDAGRDDQKK